MKEIIQAIKKRLNEFSQNIARAIENDDWSTVGRYAGLAFIAVCGIVVVFLAILVILWNTLRSFFGKILMSIIGTPLMLYVLFLSYKVNREDNLTAHQVKSESATLDEWADGIYEYVRDAMFLVFRVVAEYTNIITPSSASAIETDDRYKIDDGFVVFNFMCRLCGSVNSEQLRRDIQRTMQQKQRAHELNGISRDLVEINGAYYCPLQVLGTPQDFGEYVQVSIVFATEKTIALTRAHQLLNLGAQRRHSACSRFTDDEL